MLYRLFSIGFLSLSLIIPSNLQAEPFGPRPNGFGGPSPVGFPMGQQPRMQRPGGPGQHQGFNPHAFGHNPRVGHPAQLPVRGQAHRPMPVHPDMIRIWSDLQALSTEAMFHAYSVYMQTQLLRTQYRLDDAFCTSNVFICQNIKNFELTAVSTHSFLGNAVSFFQYTHGYDPQNTNPLAYAKTLRVNLGASGAKFRELLRTISRHARIKAANPQITTQILTKLTASLETLQRLESLVNEINGAIHAVVRYYPQGTRQYVVPVQVLGYSSSLYRGTFDFNLIDFDRKNALSDLGDRRTLEWYFLNVGALWMRSQILVALNNKNNLYATPFPAQFNIPANFPVMPGHHPQNAPAGMGNSLLAHLQTLTNNAAKLLEVWSFRDFNGDYSPIDTTQADVILQGAVKQHYDTLSATDLVFGYIRSTVHPRQARPETRLIIAELTQAESLAMNSIRLSNIIQRENILGVDGFVAPAVIYAEDRFGRGDLPYVPTNGQVPVAPNASMLPNGTPGALAPGQTNNNTDMVFNGNQVYQTQQQMEGADADVVVPNQQNQVPVQGNNNVSGSSQQIPGDNNSGEVAPGNTYPQSTGNVSGSNQTQSGYGANDVRRFDPRNTQINGQQTYGPAFGGNQQQQVDPRFQQQQQVDPRFQQQQQVDPRFQQQQQVDPRYQQQQRVDPRYQQQQRVDPRYQQQQQVDPRFQQQQQVDPRFQQQNGRPTYGPAYGNGYQGPGTNPAQQVQNRSWR